MVDASPKAATSPARVIFLGPPGAGKGTQAGLVARHFRVPKISTGDMLREAIAQKTPLGLQAGPLMEQGRLVPDPLLIGIVEDRLSQPDCGPGFVLDGFPRTLAQAEGFGTMAGGRHAGGLVVLNVEVPREELLRRLSGRRWCPDCQATFHVHNDPPKQQGICDRCGASLIQREDDKETAVARRLQEYDERTAPLIGYYGQRDAQAFHTVDGHRPVEVVFGELRGIVEGTR